MGLEREEIGQDYWEADETKAIVGVNGNNFGMVYECLISVVIANYRMVADD